MAKGKRRYGNSNSVEVEVREEKTILKLGLYQFRSHFAKTLRMLKRKEIDGMELTFRGQVIAHLTSPGGQLPLPRSLQSVPLPPEKLKPGKVDL